MRWYFDVPLGTRLVFAFAAGVATGLVLGPNSTLLAPAARLLVDVLRLLAPIVVATFVLGALSAGSLRGLGRTALLAVATCVALAAFAAATGVLTVATLRPVGPVELMLSPHAAAPVAWGTTLTGWLPWQGAGMEKAVPLVFVVTVPAALVIGAWRSAQPTGPANRLHLSLVRASQLVTRILGWVLEYAPIGTFASAAVMVGEFGGAAGRHLGGAMVGVLAAHAALAVLMISAAAALGLHPLRLAVHGREALVTALATGSSAATLPLELRVAEGPLQLPPALARTVMPLGTTFCKVGTTAFIGALGIVGGLTAGLELTWPWLAQVIAWTTVAGLATPPVSGGGFVMLALVFGQTGVPLVWVPVLTALPLIGKLNTPLNALGRLLLAAGLPRSTDR